MNAEKMVGTLMDLLNTSPLKKDQGVIVSEDGEIVGEAKLVRVKDMKIWYGPRWQIGTELAKLHGDTGKHHQMFRWWEIKGPTNIKMAVAKFKEEYKKDTDFRKNEGQDWQPPVR